MLNHLPTATFFMIPLFFNSMGYDYKEISRLRVSIDRSTFIHITTGSPARDDGTAGEFTVIGETLRKQFPVAMIYHSCPPRVISTAAKRSGEISLASAAAAIRPEISRLRVSIDINTIIPITTGSPARDDGTAGEFTVIGETLRKQFPVAMIYHSCPPRVISTAAKRSGEISLASAAAAIRPEISRLRVSIDINTIIPITTGSPARDDGTAGVTVIGETFRTPFSHPYPSNPSFSCRSPCSSVFLGQARLNRRNPSPSLPKTYPMSSHRWQS